MITANTLTGTDVVLRWMVHLDLPQAVRIGERLPGLQWSDQDFLGILRSLNTIGHVAEIGRNVVGFMVYKLHRGSEVAEEIEVDRFPERAERPADSLSGRLQIDLLNLGVTPELHRRGIGRLMLQKLDQKIQREGGCIQTLVPESNLTAQLFLRGAGYRATGIVRNFYEDGDGYLLERRGPDPGNAKSEPAGTGPDPRLAS